MIERNHLLRSLENALRTNPVVMLGGPRQSGKTTLARSLA
jgi:predicted AAA+ superfamily ATPase